ncbi:bifunctional oligoribonuclease/PAP phosphatase NrnA [Bacillus sp. AFS088145]|uniref:DHH family phosphoesterase n=1 Tax=Bacillus sp. AFS088145 TaxID=2033514 RepID=UPI000BF58869|nr:bifunctional oligoribonuclease/PAP phosphatase NrnA [Bacillus sp. AFS088145]PFH91235.1 DHH family phosphoesterase [Bacillus sp. AFS088145]
MKEKILKDIHSFDTIIIHRHVRPDPDAIGSQCGLAEMIKASYPAKKVYVVGHLPQSLEYLYKMDEIADEIYKEALVIVCDTANTERVDDARYSTGKKLIKIDHHPNVDPYGDIMHVDTTASSTSELIFELAESSNEQLVVTDTAARLIYAGIIGDTGRFLFPSTTERTFHAASNLIKKDFSINEIYDNMYETSIEMAHLNGYVLQNFKLTEEGVGHINMTKALMDEYNVNSEQASLAVSSLGHIKGVKAWVIFLEEEDLIRVRLRSKGPVINGVAAMFNGGGHPLASGAKVFSWEEAEKVVEELKKVCREEK